MSMKGLFVTDFAYTKDGKRVAEDVKGFKTDMYRLKRHLVMLKHGVEVVEYGHRLQHGAIALKVRLFED